MRVLNPNKDDVLSFNFLVQKYLLDNNHIPIYQSKDGKYYFRKTEKLKSALKNAPILVQMVLEGGIKNWAKN